MSETDRETPVPRARRRSRGSSLRVVVEENRMLFGALSRVLQRMARGIVQLRRHEHKQNNALTTVNLKLDLIMIHLGIPIPEMPPESEHAEDEDTPPDGTPDARR